MRLLSIESSCHARGEGGEGVLRPARPGSEGEGEAARGTLHAACYRLQVACCRLQAAGCRLQAWPAATRALICLTRRSVALSSEDCESESSKATLPPSPWPSSTVTCKPRAECQPTAIRGTHHGTHHGTQHGTHPGIHHCTHHGTHYETHHGMQGTTRRA